MMRVGVRAESERATEYGSKRHSNDIRQVVRVAAFTHPSLSNGVDVRLLKGQECTLILLHDHCESANDGSFE